MLFRSISYPGKSSTLKECSNFYLPVVNLVVGIKDPDHNTPPPATLTASDLPIIILQVVVRVNFKFMKVELLPESTLFSPNVHYDRHRLFVLTAWTEICMHCSSVCGCSGLSVSVNSSCPS